MGFKSMLSLVLVPLIDLPCLALARGPEDCDACVMGMTTFGQFAQGDLAGTNYPTRLCHSGVVLIHSQYPAGDRQLAVLTDTFCLNTTDPAGCGEKVAQLWPPVLTAIASDTWIPVLVCQELMACVHMTQDIPTSTPARYIILYIIR